METGSVVLAGMAQWGLVLVGVHVPRVFGWKEDLARLWPRNRRLFWVYGLFTALSNLGFGALSLVYPREIARGKGVAGGLALFLGLYWVARLGVQYGAFNTSDWPREGRSALGRHGMGAVFFLLALVYLGAFGRGLLR
jgi:hypothetical protein